MQDKETRWLARLKPTPNTTIESLLSMPLGLDVWERKGNVLVVAALEAQLDDIECRHLAYVERLSTIEDFVNDMQHRANQ